MGTLGDMLVLVDFQGDQDDELLLKTGDVVKNVKKTVEEGWLEGELNGKKGLFPQLFVKEIPSNFKNDNDQRYPRSIRRTQAPLQTKKQRLCKAEYSYTPLKADELELVAGEIFEVIEEIEDGWWLGKKGEVVGAFPSNFVQEITEPPTDKVPDLKKNNKQRPKMADINFAPKDIEKAQENKPVVKNQNKDQAPLPPIIKEFCRVMFDYEPSAPDELTMKKGDMVLILSKETEDEGWWKGEINGRSGLFPDNFVILLPPKSNIKTKKLPTRRSAIKAPVAKAEVTTMDKKVAEVSRPESPASKGQKDQKDAKNNSTPKVTNQPAKKSTPPPPVPKSKPNPVPTAKPASETPTKPVEDTTVKSKDSNPTLDGLRVSSVKLAHPTADRPKMPGKRLPKNKTGLPENVISLPEPVLKKNEEQVNSHCKSPTSAKASPKFSTSPNQVPVPTTTKTITRTPSTNSTPKRSPEPTENHVTPSQTLQIEELMAEIKALKLMMEMLKNNHTKDIETLRGEINEERTKRTALQSEIESLKKMTSS